MNFENLKKIIKGNHLVNKIIKKIQPYLEDDR